MQTTSTASVGLPTLLPVRSLADKGREAAEAFARRFGCAPSWLACAPGRVNVIGEHVDYCEGLVMPMAIDRHVIMAASPIAEPVIKIFSEVNCEDAAVPLDRDIERGQPAWSNYLRGVIHGYRERGETIRGLQILIDTDLPIGGGLSSSAALEVATVTILDLAGGSRLPSIEKALLCQRAERDFAGVPCGIMDQFASVFGQENDLLLIDCRSHEVTPVPLHDDSVTFLVINTNIRHNLGNSEYPVRRAQCEEAAQRLGLSSLRDATLAQLDEKSSDWPEVIKKRARHVIGEIARTQQAADLVQRGDWRGVGELMYASHDSLRDDFEVSCPELDLVVRAAREIGPDGGVFGCRMTGGGFGGCCIAVVDAKRAEAIAAALGDRYHSETGVVPTMFVSRPAAGAGPLELPTLPPKS